ncbi:galactose mutarotase [Pedobacter sp. ISL-68]|uniref:aldose epimerase family protein n=1 Tax=unclassified Pedobacter TaxID=2628915 RepID=UPI001BE770BB|nr:MULTISPECIES: aldose epimerase family protein [unclassified Pedobacter]MBT2561625.1 galactose mutarotase [Pedobacter sp. ISL-64]MBT2591014.1 galactose mutarotase [Pedobacter sp. ISL-68]
MKLQSLTSLGILAVIGFASCQSGTKKSSSADRLKNDSIAVVKLVADSFKKEIDGKQTMLYTLKNKNDAEAIFTNYGGRLVSLLVPNKDGKLVDVVVGFKSINDYEKSTEPYFGATIGRYGNRIAKGKFTLEGKTYSLFTNNGQNTLHGGKKGYQYVVWDASQPNANTLVLHYLSKDGDENFPGNLDVKVTYTLTDDNELKMDYEAKTDKTTIVNLTNHAFFNLNGDGSGEILNHEVQIYADEYTPVDSSLIPTGKIEKVKGTPFDFTKATTIGARINDKNEQLTFGKGYDHNYVLNKTKAMGMFHAATVKGDKSGIVMDIYTQEPGLQFYSGNFMQSKNTFKTGAKDDFRTAIALETQHFPDSPNQPAFPSTVLKPGQVYKTSSVYKFTK